MTQGSELRAPSASVFDVGCEALSRLFDRVSFWILASGAAALNAALVLAAA